MCKSFVMIYRETLPVDVSRIPLSVSRHHPYPFHRDRRDCQLGSQQKKKKKKVGPSAPLAIVFITPRFFLDRGFH
jgi:hypothetical protein